jgi:hypothetical protein
MSIRKSGGLENGGNRCAPAKSSPGTAPAGTLISPHPTPRLRPRRHSGHRQRVAVGLRHAGRIVTIEIGETVLRVFDERGDTLINQVPRTSTKTLARFKAYGVHRNCTTG